MSGLGLRERLAERRGKGHGGVVVADLGNGGLAARGPAELPLQAEHHGPTGDDGGDEGGRDKGCNSIDLCDLGWGLGQV